MSRSICSYVVVVQELGEFITTFGPMSAVVGEYGGNLKRGGETLSLIKPGAVPEEDRVIDEVTYDSRPPWPAGANGLGFSLQLIDAAQDNNRSANWAVATGTQKKATPGASNSARTTLSAFPTLWLNEICPTNPPVAGGGERLDGFGQRDPWLEIYNGGTNTVSLVGFSLANQFTNLTQWSFPADSSVAPGQFLLVWLDGEVAQSSVSELHTSFRAEPAVGSVVLSRGSSLSSVVDYLSYSTPVAGRSDGSYPDGNVSGRRLFPVMTPGASNNPAYPPFDVRINEWMAENLITLTDPADADYEDWFELWNPGEERVDLTGCTLTDDTTTPSQFKIPAGTTLEPHGFLLVWADGERNQNSPESPDLHANFSLSKNGEMIALYGPDGKVLDAVLFGPQTRDVSQGCVD